MLNDLDLRQTKVFVACGYTDLRCGIDGLAQTVQKSFTLTPFQKNQLFLFCGRRQDRIKGLLWEGDGFLLLYKRWESGRLRWPRNEEELRELNAEEFRRLIQGFALDPGVKKVPLPQHML